MQQKIVPCNVLFGQKVWNDTERTTEHNKFRNWSEPGRHYTSANMSN